MPDRGMSPGLHLLFGVMFSIQCGMGPALLLAAPQEVHQHPDIVWVVCSWTGAAAACAIWHLLMSVAKRAVELLNG